LTKWVEEHSLEERTKMLNTLFEFIRQKKLKLFLESWDFERFTQALAHSQTPKERKVVLEMR